MKKYLIAAFIAALAAIYYLNQVCPPAEIHREDKVHKFHAQELFDRYWEKPVLFERLYQDKLIEVEGEVNELDRDVYGERILVLKENDDILGIACTMDETTEENRMKAEAVKLKERVVVKGICKSFDSEVKLTGCIVVRSGKSAPPLLSNIAYRHDFYQVYK